MSEFKVKPSHLLRGHGVSLNPAVRFDRFLTEAVGDDWDREEDLPVRRTEVTEERPREVISRNTSPDLSINTYRGCEHGCVYCFARSSHAYLGLSPGLDFESKFIVWPDALAFLEKELRAKSYNLGMIAFGTNTDPYQSIEKDRGIMREILKVLRDLNYLAGIVTKGTLIAYDIDILADLAKLDLVRVGISVTTLDPHVLRVMEPHVPAPKARLRSIRQLTEAGIPVRVIVSPMISTLTDYEVAHILDAAKEAGATAVSGIVLRLPLEVS